MLAIANDIDQMRVPRFRAIHRFLNTKADTPLGPGLGLDIADSFWFYGRSTGRQQEDDSDFTYFRGLTWDERSPLAAELTDYIQCGWIDAIHSYGNFSGVPRGKQCTREHAVHALDAISPLGVRPRIWINHGSTENIQNIGPADYMQGDRPDSDCYHWDLLRAAGVEYLWDGSGSDQLSRPTTLIPLDLRDGSKAWGFRRFYTLDFDGAIAHGLRASVAEQMRRTRNYAVLWHPQHLHVQLSDRHLEELSASGGFSILAQHLGAAPRILILGGPAVTALRRLATLQEQGVILVARTSRLLDFNRTREFVRFTVSEDDDVTSVNITSIEDPIFGPGPPTPERLRGLAFYVPDAARARLLIEGVPVDEELVQRNPTDGEAPSIGLRWHEPDQTDYTEEFAAAGATPRRQARPPDDDDATRTTALDLLAKDAEGPVPDGVSQSTYEYAVRYTRHRYEALGVAARQLDELGFTGAGRGLDIGSGAGHWCVAFLRTNERVVGIDTRPEFVELATRIATALGLEDRASYIVGRAEQLPFDRGSFDVAWSHGVLQFTDTEIAIAEACRVLKHRALFYCGYSGFGFRLSAIHAPLVKGAEAAAKGQIGGLLGTRSYRNGLYSTPWWRIRAPRLDDVIAIAEAYGMRHVDEPQIQDDSRHFLGLPVTMDVLLQKQSEPEDLPAELAARSADDSLYGALERLVAIGSPRSAISALRQRSDVMEDPRLRRVLLAALVKAGEVDDEIVDSLVSAENDKLLKGKLCEQRGDYEGAHALYAEAEDASTPFLAGSCLLALHRLPEAAAALSQGAESDDVESAIDCRVALCAVAAEQGLDAMAREFASLLEWLGAQHGREDEARELISRLPLQVDATPSRGAAAG